MIDVLYTAVSTFAEHLLVLAFITLVAYFLVNMLRTTFLPLYLLLSLVRYLFRSP